MLWSFGGWGQPLLLEENFEYPVGTLPTTYWNTANTGTSVAIEEGSLSYLDYMSSGIGNYAKMNQGLDYNRTIGTINSGSVYAAMLVRVTATTASGDYFVHFTQAGTTYKGRLWAKTSGSGVAFGIAKSGTTPPVSYSGEYALNQDHLIVMKYTFNSGTTTDDIVELIINPIVGAAEPAVTVTASDNSTTDATSLTLFGLRQAAANAPTLYIDGIRVATTWDEAVKTGPPIATFNPIDNASDVAITVTPTITFSKAIRNIDDSEITDLNVASLLTFTDPSKAAVPFTANIDGDKKIITVTPNANLTNEEYYTLSIAPVEDVSNNATEAQSITFSTVSADQTIALTLEPSAMYYAGEDVTVNWTSTNITTVNVDVWIPSEGMWVNMTSASGAGGTATFQIPTTAEYSTDYKVRVSDSENGIPSDISGTFKVRPVVNDIASLRSEPVGTEVKLASEAILTFQSTSRSTKYIQDATGAILIDDPTGIIVTTYNLYDGITGLVGTISTNASMLQIVPLDDPGAASSTGNTVTPIEVTLANLTTTYQGKLVKVRNTSFSATGNFAATTNYTITDPSGSGVVRTHYSDVNFIGQPIPEVPKNITGVVLQFNTTMQLIPRALTDFATIYNININPVSGGTADVATSPVTIAEAGETVTITISNIQEGKKFKSIEVKDADLGDVTVNETTYGAEYNFTMPAKNVDITLTLEDKQFVTFYFQGPDWMDNNPHNPEVWGPFMGPWTGNTLVQIPNTNWWSKAVEVTDATAEITYQMRFSQDGTTKYQKQTGNMGADATFTTTTGKIFVDASDNGSYTWNLNDFYLSADKITQDAPDNFKVAIDKAALGFEDFTFAPTEDQTTIKSDFTLPIVGEEHSSTISWASDNAAISISGANATVNRPLAGSKANASVNLTATIVNGGANDTKVMAVTVLEDKSTFSVALAVPGSKVRDTNFDLSITNGKDDDGNLLSGNIAVLITSDEHVGNVYSENVAFTDGEATVTISLSEVADHTLTVAVTGVAESKTVAVTIIPVSYTVTFSVVGENGTITAKADGVDISSGDYVYEDSEVIFTAAPATGYKVKEWRKDGDIVGGIDLTYTIASLSANNNVTVEFEIKTYAVDFSVDGTNGALVATVDLTGLTTGDLVEHGSMVVFTATPDANYRVMEWRLDGDIIVGHKESTYTINSLEAAVNVTVKFEAIPQYDVTFSVFGANGTIAATVDAASISSGDDIYEGKDVVFTATPADGYRVKEWTVNTVVQVGQIANTFTYTSLDKAIAVTVEFELIPAGTFTVTFNVVGGNGDLDAQVGVTPIVSGASIAEGSNILFTATPNVGYEIKEWKLDGAVITDHTDLTYTLNNLSANSVVTVEFKIKKYAVTYSVIGTNGTLDATVNSADINSGDLINHGSDVVFTAVPATGYKVKEWKKDGSTVVGNTTNSYTITGLTASATVSVEFEIITYTVTYSVTGTPANGTLAAAVNSTPVATGGTVNYGSNVVFTATPSAGYRVKEWRKEGTVVTGNTTNSYTISGITANATVTVEFELITYTVTFSVVGTPANGTLAATVNSAPITTGGAVNQGSNVVFTATPAANYKVKEWKKDGAVIEGNTTTTYTLNDLQANATVTVEFELVTFTVTFAVEGGNGAIQAKVDGSLIASASAVQATKNIVFSAIPVPGYQVKSWTVGTTVQPGETENTFTYNNLLANISVKVEFEEEEYIPSPDLLMVEEFDYAVDALLSDHGWNVHHAGGATPNPIKVVSPGLSFTDYLSSNIGNAAGINNTGQDIHKSFTQQTEGSVYAAFLVNVTAPVNGYFLHLGPTTIDGTDFRGRVWIDGTVSPFKFGLSKHNDAAQYSSNTYNASTTYLLVLKYSIIEGANNDLVSLYVFDTFPSSEPGTPTVGPINATDYTDINPNSIGLRQFLADQRIAVDGIRVAKTWAEAVKSTSAELSLTFTPAQGATNVALNVNPTIAFTKAVRNIDDSPIADPTSLLSLTKDGAENVAFTATINAEKTLITVDPTADLAKETSYTLSINPVEDASGNATLLQGVTFTTIPRSDVTTLSAFTLGGVNALTLQNVVVTNPTTDAGAMLFVANFTGFAGIVATATDANATRTVKVNGVDVAPGDLATKPLAKDDVVLITVVAENTVATKYYKVTLTDQANSAAEILTYSIAGQVGDAVITPGTTAGTIAVTVPYGTNLTALVATFTLSDGATVKVGSDVQVSGTTANNFTNPVVYVVTAENTTTTKNWTVTVTPEAGSSSAEILTYSLAGQIGNAVITSGAITINVPNGTDVTALVATFAISDLATIKVGDVVQVSGTTANNFTSPVTYVVTSQNGTTKNWVVTVNFQALPPIIFTETMGTVTANTSIAIHEAANGFDNDNLTMTSGGITDPADVRTTSTSTGYTGASGNANIFFTSTAGERGFAIEGINTANYTDLKLQFGYRKEDGSSLPTLAVDYWNGTAYVNVPFTFAEAANAATGWYLSPEILLPAAAQIDGLKLRWVKSGSVAVRIDDIKLFVTPPDTEAPTVTFVPADAAADVLVNVTPTITFNEAVRNIDNSEITNTNVASLLTFKQGTTDVAFTAAINDAKKVITITPTAALENEKDYTVTIAPVEDANDNATTQQSATFTTISATTPVLDLTSTHAGPYYVGDDVTVTWTSANIDNVAVEMYTPSTETWAPVNEGAASVAATLGTYTFAIPATTPFGTAYKLRVKNAAAATPVEESDAFTIRLVVNTLAQLRALSANVEAKYTGTALVTYARPSAGRNQKYIQDASGAILIDDASGIITSAYVAGSKMTGLVGKISIYNAMVQVVPLTDPGAAVSTGNPVVPTVTDLASLTSADQAKLIRVPSVTFTSTGTFASGQNYDIEDPSGSKADGVFRTAFSEADYIGEAIPEITLNAMVALVGEFNGTMQLTSRNLADFIMPVNDDATLFAFTIGGLDALSLEDVVVEDPAVDEGATLIVENFTNFKGIVATPNQNSATVSVSLNGSVVSVADLTTQPIAEGDVIVVTVVAADGETTMYYKVTTEQAEVETFTVTFNVVDADEVAITDAVITFAGETYDAGDYEITEVIPGTYSYKVSKVGYLSAYGSVEVVDADVTVDVTLVEGSAMSLPFSEDFEVENPAETPDTYLPEGWLAVDDDGDEFNWYWGFRETDSNGSMRSESYDSVTTDPLTPDNWLITPAIDMNTEETSITLSFKVAPTASTPSYRQEHYSVLISTTDTELESFETIYEETLETTATNWIYVEKKVDLTDYMGQIVYIAFRHHDVTDMDRITLDDVMVYAGGISAEIQPIADIKVFPNPFRDYITIANASSVDRVVITNIIGQTLMNLRFDGVEGQINTSNLQRGIYLIAFYGKNGERVVRKMIKE